MQPEEMAQYNLQPGISNFNYMPHDPITTDNYMKRSISYEQLLPRDQSFMRLKSSERANGYVSEDITARKKGPKSVSSHGAGGKKLKKSQSKQGKKKSKNKKRKTSG